MKNFKKREKPNSKFTSYITNYSPSMQIELKKKKKKKLDDDSKNYSMIRNRDQVIKEFFEGMIVDQGPGEKKKKIKLNKQG